MNQRGIHTVWQRAQYVNKEESARESELLLEDSLGINYWVVSNCIVHHLSWVLYPSFCYIDFHLNCYDYYYILF